MRATGLSFRLAEEGVWGPGDPRGALSDTQIYGGQSHPTGTDVLRALAHLTLGITAPAGVWNLVVRIGSAEDIAMENTGAVSGPPSGPAQKDSTEHQCRGFIRGNGAAEEVVSSTDASAYLGFLLLVYIQKRIRAHVIIMLLHQTLSASL